MKLFCIAMFYAKIILQKRMLVIIYWIFLRIIYLFLAQSNSYTIRVIKKIKSHLKAYVSQATFPIGTFFILHFRQATAWCFGLTKICPRFDNLKAGAGSIMMLCFVQRAPAIVGPSSKIQSSPHPGSRSAKFPSCPG